MREATSLASLEVTDLTGGSSLPMVPGPDSVMAGKAFACPTLTDLEGGLTPFDVRLQRWRLFFPDSDG
jgi:hypothetical protein